MEKSQRKKEKKTYWLILSGLIFFKKNSPLYLRPWILFYFILRKIKNKKDLKKENNPIAQAVGKAYSDFKHVK